MSNGDDETADAPEDAADEAAPADTGEESTAGDVDADTLDSRLDEVETAIESAESEADLDEAEADLDSIAADLEAADLPEPDDDEDADADADVPAEALASRVEDLRDALEEARGPYADDVEAVLDEAASTVRDTRWTDNGEADVHADVEGFLDAANEHLEVTVEAAGDDLDALAAAVEAAGEAVTDAGFDPDEDAETIAGLLEAAEELESDLEAAEEWSDLTVVEQLRSQGFYERVTPENRKDFPPELTVVRVAEAENDPERILLALEAFESDFMEENCLDALKRLGPEAAVEPMLELAEKRQQDPIEVLGKIGDERAVDTLVEFVDSDNPPLQTVTLRALGEIGSEKATQAVANALDDDEAVVRSQAARALGLVGDTRAIHPLERRLADRDEATTVRAAAAWALVQIGTERALEAAAQYDDDRAYTVQVEAEKARDVTVA